MRSASVSDDLRWTPADCLSTHHFHGKCKVLQHVFPFLGPFWHSGKLKTYQNLKVVILRSIVHSKRWRTSPFTHRLCYQVLGFSCECHIIISSNLLAIGYINQKFTQIPLVQPVPGERGAIPFCHCLVSLAITVCQRYLVDCGRWNEGSIKGFDLGTHFERCILRMKIWR